MSKKITNGLYSSTYPSYKTTYTSIHTTEDILEKDQKCKNKSEPWNKLNKTLKVKYLNDFGDKYIQEHSLHSKMKGILQSFFIEALEKGKLQKTKDLVFDKNIQEIIAIPSLHLNSISNAFTLRNVDPKRVSTLKSLTPLRRSEAFPTTI